MKRHPWVAALGIASILAAVIVIWSYKTIHLEVDGQSTTFRAFAWTVNDVLRQSGVSLSAADRVEPAPSQWLDWESTLRVAHAAQIVLIADGKQQVLLSASRVPVDLLAQAGITLRPGDLLLADGKVIPPDQPLAPYGTDRHAPLLQVQRQVSFEVAVTDPPQKLNTTETRVGAALWQNGLAIRSSDRITPALDAAVSGGLLISLRRAQAITITSEGMTITLPSAAGSVGEALASAGLAPQGLDYTIPPEAEPLPADGHIRLVRVREEVLIEQVPLPFETSYQPAADVEIDNQVVLQAGEYGLSARRVRLRYEDGVELSRNTEAEWIARSPQDRIIGYGTEIVQHTLDTPDGTITYWRALQMYAVSYHPGETGGETTASGLKVRKGLAAVDTRYIPFYTQMYVPGYGPAMAADTGGGVKGRIIDLAYPTDEYVAWHEYVTVYFLWPPPDNIVWIIP